MKQTLKFKLIFQHIQLAAIMMLILAGSAVASDAISLQASEPATIYYTTNGAVPTTIESTSPRPTGKSNLTESSFPLPGVILTDTPDDPARKDAEKEFASYVSNPYRRDTLVQQGIFTNYDEIDRAVLAEHFQEVQFDLKKIGADDSPYNPKWHIRRDYNYRLYLVRVDGVPKAVFKISKLYASGIETLRYGSLASQAAVIARGLNYLLTAWPASEGYRYRIIRDGWEILTNLNGENKRHNLHSTIELWKNDNLIGFIVFIEQETAKQLSGKHVEFKINEHPTGTDLLEPDQFMAKLRASMKTPIENKLKLLKRKPQ